MTSWHCSVTNKKADQTIHQLVGLKLLLLASGSLNKNQDSRSPCFMATATSSCSSFILKRCLAIYVITNFEVLSAICYLRANFSEAICYRYRVSLCAIAKEEIHARERDLVQQTVHVMEHVHTPTHGLQEKAVQPAVPACTVSYANAMRTAACLTKMQCVEGAYLSRSFPRVLLIFQRMPRS